MTETHASQSASDQIARLRIIDASVNRASEGLRVVEDYTRFALDDRHLTSLLKQLRHELNQTIELIPATLRYSARDTQADVGTSLASPSDQQRVSAREVAEASLRRLAEALRSIEEYSKCFYPAVSATVESLRYRLYTIGRAISSTTRAVDTLAGRFLYVLVDAAGPMETWQARLQRLLTARIDVIQLRDKRVPDRELLARARCLRELTRHHQTLFIINDRPDIARLSQADGVHLGQDELTVKDARLIVGPELLIGVSTHHLEQARQAVLDGADYLGCGPVFPSQTKTFSEFPGLAYLRQVQAEIRLPAFAIGGIDPETIAQVRETGFTRVAVSRALWESDTPAVSVAQLRQHLQPRG
jgi:thiamine-phosphate pyrophosphorylase